MIPSRAAMAAILLTAGSLAGQTAEQRYADWAVPVFPPQEYSTRRTHMLDLLAEAGSGILLVPSSDGATGGATFRQLDDFLYLTGLEVPGSVLVLDGASGTQTLFLPARDPRFDNPGRPNDFPGRPILDDADFVRATGFERVRDVRTLDDALRRWEREGRRVLLDMGTAGPVGQPSPSLGGTLDAAHSFLLTLHREHPRLEVGNAFALVARRRMRKSPLEVEALRRAARVTADAIRATAAAIRPGVDERTLQGIFEAACRKGGAQRIPFTPIVKSGRNSLWPWRILAAHYDRRNRVLEPGDVVILDVGCEVDGYVSDVGRTFPAGGGFPAAHRRKLEMITRVSDAVIAAVRPGIRLADLTRVAYDAIPDEEKPYMQTPSYFGHHIGLSAGDPALPDEPLAPGMTFTVEPWYYNHDLGVSVFVEDVVLVTEDGAEVLTRGLSRDIRSLERMASPAHL